MRTAFRRAVRHVSRTVRGSILSSLGWATTATSLACIATSALLGWRELFAAGFAGFGIVVCAAIMATRTPHLAATLDVRGTSVNMGDAIGVTACITAKRHHPTATAAHCTFRIGNDTRRIDIRSVTPASPHNLTLTIPADRRAVIPIGPLVATTGDPLGLARRSVALTSTVNVHVHPRILQTGPLPIGVTHDLEGRSGSDPASNDLDLYELRDYVPGDDLRHVHWPSSAKTGSLLVRRYQATQHTAIRLLLDLNAHSYAAPEEFELAVTLYASLGVQALREHRPLATGDDSHRIRVHDANTFLDRCSALQTSPGACNTTPIFHTPIFQGPAGPGQPNSATGPNRSDGPDGHASHNAAAISLYLVVVGSQLPLNDIRRFARTVSASPVILLRSAIGEQSGVAWDAVHHLVTVGAPKDLPFVMEALR